MIEQLFGSKTRVKLLQLFYSNPNRSFYVREITRKIDEQINSVRRELANLLSIGIISSDTTNNRLYYEVNQKYDFYPQLAVIFGRPAAKAKKTAVQTTDEHDIASLGNVVLAFFTGQFTRDETPGIDLLIVGDVNQTKLQHFIEELEQKEGMEIRYTVMKPDEFEYRQQVKDRFLSIVMTARKQVLVDRLGVFEPAEKPAKKEK